MRGDRVEIVVAADNGTLTYEIAATRAGRRVEISTVRGVVEVAEVTRTGEPVRRARFMASRVLALVEHPAGEAEDARRDGATAARPGPSDDQDALWGDAAQQPAASATGDE